MKQLKQIFEYQGQLIRTVVKCGEPWFVAKDVCSILELGNPSQVLTRLDDDEKNTIILNEGIGNPEKSIVNEPGLYALILGSRKPEAKAFKRWVTHEVLPSIRKTGQYSLHNNPNAILKRHLAIATTLGKGLPKDKQIELRRLAVIEAAKESGADYSAFLAVLETSRVFEKDRFYDVSRDVDLFLQEVAKGLRRYHVHGNYLELPPSEERKLCEKLNIDRMVVLRELEKQGVIKTYHGWNNGTRKKNYTHQSAFYGKRRCVYLNLNCINIQGE